jgi:hypothetical protein
VNSQSLVDVRSNEVIVTRLSTSGHVGGRTRGQLCETEHRVDVGLLLFRRKGPPIATNA